MRSGPGDLDGLNELIVHLIVFLGYQFLWRVPILLGSTFNSEFFHDSGNLSLLIQESAHEEAVFYFCVLSSTNY